MLVTASTTPPSLFTDFDLKLKFIIAPDRITTTMAKKLFARVRKFTTAIPIERILVYLYLTMFQHEEIT
jgi:hypothetical protein